MMTAEIAILKAYAFALQGRYAESEQLLESAQGAIDTPSGADLLARIRFEQGFEAEARRIWLRIQEVFPDYEPAAKALDAFENPPPADEELGGKPLGLRKKLLMAALAAIVVGIAVSLLASIKICRAKRLGPEPRFEVVTNFVDRVETKFVERCTTNFIDRIQTQYRDRIVTNVVDRVIEIPSSITITNVVENIVWVTNKVTTIATSNNDSPAITNIQDSTIDDNQYDGTVKIHQSGKYVFGTPYTVKEGDTVSKLSSMYHFRIPDFKACNPEINIDRIRVGQIVILPGVIKVEESP